MTIYGVGLGGNSAVLRVAAGRVRPCFPFTRLPPSQRKKNFKKATKSQTPGIKPATFLSSRKIWFETCLEKATGIHHRLNCWGGKSGINLGPPRFPSFTPRSIEITSAFSILRKCAGYAPELSFTHRFKTSFLDFIFFSRSARKRAVSIRNFSYKVSINILQIIENGSLARCRSKA